MSDLLLPARGELAPEITAQADDWKTRRQEDIDFEAWQELKITRAAEESTGIRMEKNRERLNFYKQRRLQRGEQPFQYLEKAQRRQQVERFQEQVPFFSTLFSGPEQFTAAFPEEHRQGVEERFAESLNPAAEKIATANKMLFEAMTGEEVDPDLWNVQRSRYAMDVLGAQGPVDDATFYSLAGKKLAGEKSDGELAERIADKVRAAAISTRPLPEALAEAKALAGDRWKDFETTARSAYAGVLADYDDDELATARELFQRTAKMEGADVAKVAGDGTAFLNYAKANPQERERIMGLLALQAQGEGQDVQGYFQRLGQALSTVPERLSRGLVSNTERTRAELTRTLIERGQLPADAKGLATWDIAELRAAEDATRPEPQGAGLQTPAVPLRPMTPQEKELLEGFAGISEGQAAFVQDVRTAGVKVRRFLDENRKGFWNSLDDWSLMAVESFGPMATAAVPVVGLGVLANSYVEERNSSLRREYPEMPEDQRMVLATTIGAIEAGIDRLQFFTLGARVPKLNAALLKWGKPGAVAVAALRAGGVTAVEGGQEVVQDLTAPAVQELASALSADIPGVKWAPVLEKEREALGDIFGVSMIFGIIGGAGSTVVDVMAAPKLKAALTDREGLALAGYTPETVEAVAKLAETNPAAAAETLKAATIETPAEVRKANSAAAKARIEADPPPTAEEAAIPEIIRMPDGSFGVKYPGGQIDPARSQMDAMEAVRVWEMDDLNQMDMANRELARELEATHSANPELGVSTKFTGRTVTMADWAGTNAAKIEQARQRVRIALRQEFQAGERKDDGSAIPDAQLPLDAYLILGSSKNFGGAVTRISMEIHKRGNVATVLEEHAEGVAKWAMESGKYLRADMIRGIRETEAALGKQTLPDDLDSMAPEAATQAIVEAFSRLAVANAFGKVQESSLSAKFKALFRALKEAFTAILSLAGEIRTLQLAGQMDAQFEYWLDVAGGVSEQYQQENLQREAEREMLAEAFDGIPEVTATVRGMLPHPDTPGVMFQGELRAIYDGLANSAASGANKAARTRTANAFFLPVGERADLDEVREFLNEKGFGFDTPADMLEAVDLSVNYGKPQYGLGANGDQGFEGESFSVGRADVTPTARTRAFPGAEGSPSVIGPATFSIRAFHGTPHKVDKFTTEKIGTGEGAQAYGWGLYFAESEGVAKSYLSAGNSEAAAAKAIRSEQAYSRGRDLLGREYDIPKSNRYYAKLYAKATGGNYQTILDYLEGRRSGNLYTVTLKVEDDQLLDWDKPLSEQPKAVKAALTEALDLYREINPLDFKNYLEGDPRGSMIVQFLPSGGTSLTTTPEQVTRDLRAAGIRGIRYLDGNSRGDGAGSYNYVIFDEADIEIVEENGTPVSMATFSAVRADSELLKAIDALADAPEATAKVFSKMRDKVTEVRERMNTERRSAGFSEEELDPDRFEKLRDIATLEAVGKALPKAIRGIIVGAFRPLEELKTAKGRESYLVKLLPKIEQALEAHLQDQFRQAIRREMQRGAVKVAEAKTRGGKIGATGHEIFDMARAAMTMDPETAAAEAEKIQARIEGGDTLTMEQLTELDAKLAAVELFADYQNADSRRLEGALELLKETYREGRKAWLETLMERRALRDERIHLLRRGLGLTFMDADGIEKPVRITDAMRNAAKRADEKVGTKLLESTMAFLLSGPQKIGRLRELSTDPLVKQTVTEMEDAFAAAEALETDLNLADNAELAAAMRATLGVSTEYQLAAKLRELSEAKGASPVEKIEGFKKETITVPINVVESLLAGETAGFTTPGGVKVELDAHDLEALQEQWDRFQDLQEEEQGRKRTLTFDRLIASGQRTTIGEVSQLEGLQLLLTMRQPDQARKLDRLGYDAETLAQLEAWLKPEVKALGAWMVGKLKSEQDAVDALHRQEKGVALRLVENYFPVRNDVSGSDSAGLSLDGGQAQQTGRSVGFIKERVANNAPPAYVNALAVFLAHRAQSNFWKSHVTPMREWGGIVRDERFSAAVKVKLGGSYYQALARTMERIEAGGVLGARQVLGFERVVKVLMRHFSLGTLGLRFSTLIVNTTAVLNPGLEVPSRDLVKGMMLAGKRPQAFKDAWNSPVIQRRLKDGGSIEVKLAKSSGPSTRPILAVFQSLAEKGVAPINVIDTAANLLGATSVWELTRTRATRAGLPDEQARAEADRAVERMFRRAAQPASRFSRSEIEMRALDNPLSALLSLFISEPRKNAAIAFLAGRELLTGKGTYGKKMAAQQLVVAMVVMVAAERVVRSFYEALAKAEDDDEDGVFARWWGKLTDGKAWAHAFATSHLRAIPLVGEAWNQVAASALDQKVFDSSPNPLNKAARVGVDFVKDMGEEKTAEETIEGGIDIVQAFGSALPGGPIFAQVANVADFAEGVATSNGVDLSKADRAARIKARWAKHGKELTELHGPTTGEDGKIRKDIQAKKNTAKADWLRSALAPLPADEREKVLEEVNPSEAVRKLLAR